jgi:hypothetical protein
MGIEIGARDIVGRGFEQDCRGESRNGETTQRLALVAPGIQVPVASVPREALGREGALADLVAAARAVGDANPAMPQEPLIAQLAKCAANRRLRAFQLPHQVAQRNRGASRAEGPEIVHAIELIHAASLTCALPSFGKIRCRRWEPKHRRFTQQTTFDRTAAGL